MENERKQKLQFTLAEKSIVELNELAKAKGISKSAVVALALELFSKKEKENNKD
jgi:hypothetical protein